MAYVPHPIAPARRKVLLRAVCDGRRIGLTTAPLDDAPDAFRRHFGAHWFAPRRMWTLRAGVDGRTLADGLAAAVPKRRLDLDEVRALVDGALAAPQADFFAELLDLQVIPLDDGGHAVSGAYDNFSMEAMRSLQGRFHRYAAAWEVRHSTARILDALQRIAGVDPVYVFVHETSMHLEDLVAKPKSPIPISVPAASPPKGDGGAGDTEFGAGFLSSCARALEHLPVDEAALAKATIDFSLMEQRIGNPMAPWGVCLRLAVAVNRGFWAKSC
jgi:hypothetical protein